MFDLETNFPKTYAITSPVIPPDFWCFYNDANDKFRISTDYTHEIQEFIGLDGLASISINEDTRYIAIAMGKGDGIYESASFQCGPIATLCPYESRFLMVLPNGDYIVAGQDGASWFYPCFPPEMFGLEPFPYWKGKLGKDISAGLNLFV